MSISWWSNLSALNQAFFVAAMFFTTIFVWQFVSSLGGLGGDEPGDVDADAELGDGDMGDGDLLEDASGMATLRLLSIRSIIAFGTLFSWAGALYLAEDRSMFSAMGLGVAWGVAGMLVVALFFWALPHLTEEGTADLDTALGKAGQVYMDIPENGTGQARVVVSGTVSFIKARSRDGRRLPAGTPVRVIGRLDSSTLEVEAITPGTEE